MRRLRLSFCLSGALLANAAAAIAAEQPSCPPGARCETPATSAAVASPAAPATPALPADAAQAEPSDAEASPSLAVMTNLGIATPTGLAGMSLDFMPVRYVALQAGAGTNLEGMEFEAGARLRLPVLKSGRYLTLGAGWSEATHYTGHELNGLAGFGRILESMAEGSISNAVWKHAQFLNVDLGVEHRERHLLTRIYLGYARMLNPAGYKCTAGDFPCKPEAGTGLTYLGIAFGYAF